MNNKSFLLSPFSLGVASILCFLLFLALQTSTAFAASIIFDPTKRVAPEDVTSLPVQLTETEKNLTDEYFRLPEGGDYIGVFTRPITLYEKNNMFSAVFSQLTTAKSSDGEPYLGIFSPITALFKSALPQPTITNAVYLTGVDFLSVTDDVVTFDPPAAFRLPLAEPQYGNTEITVYFYDQDEKNYVQIEGTLSSDQKGYLFPAAKTGIYAIFAASGEIIESSPEPEVTTEDDAELDQLDENDGEVVDANTDEVAEVVEEAQKELPQVPQAKPVFTSFRDMAGHWALPFVATLAEAGLTGNAPIYSPDAPATRAELAKLIAEYKFSSTEIDDCIATHIPSPYIPVFFIDVAQQSPYAKYICTLAVAQISTGLKDGSFAPDATLSRAEALKLLYTAADKSQLDEMTPPPFEDVVSSDWFYTAVARAVSEGIANGFTVQTSDDSLHISSERINNNERSDNALILQKILQSIGFYTGELDGTVSSAVSQAVLQYQLSRGIIKTPQDLTAGNIGPSTIASLNSENAGAKTEVRRLFRPHDSVTRAEMAKFAVLILEM